MRCFPISTTPWFSNEGWVRFGRWVLFPSNVAVSIYQDFWSLLLCSNYLLLSMIIIAWLLFWSKKSELFCHHWSSRWNFAWLSQPTCTPTSLIAPIWLPLLRHLIRFGTFDHFFSFSWIFHRLFLVRKVCSWVWQCRLRLSWCSSSSAWSSPSPLHTGLPSTTLSTRGSSSKKDLSNFELQLSYKSSASLIRNYSKRVTEKHCM